MLEAPNFRKLTMRHFSFLTIFVGALVLNSTASAQVYEGKRIVEASLLADTNAIVPGRPFTAGLLLKIAPDWHTYWQYPGDAGIPTQIEWLLPPGFQAGNIRWPLPEKLTEEGDLQTYVYRDEVLLQVEIRPPAKLEAKQITLNGKARWLVCKSMCIPGDGEVSLTLPVTSQSRAANEVIFSKYRALLPKIGSKVLSYKWETRGDLDVLKLDNLKITGSKVDFYPMPPKGLAVEHPLKSSDGKGAVEIQVKIRSGQADQLAGVLVLGDGASRESWFIAPQSSTPPLTSATVVSMGAPATASSLLRYLLFGFFGGMLLNVMPCVLPVITLKIYGFINQAGQSRRRIMELGLAYCAGVFAWFLGLAALIVVFGLNWSFQFQSKGFIVAMLVICVMFGLNLLGMFEVMLPGNLNTKLALLASKEGLGGAFVHGLFATLMGSACTAPLLGPAIGFALVQPPPVIFTFFGTIAAGMALPYFMLTLNPEWMKFLPKPGMWMVRIKQVMGALVLATALWFAHVLYQQISVMHEAFAPVLNNALKSGRTVFVDFTAEWCINCKYNEKLVLKSDAVQAAFKEGNVLFLKADWTNGDPDITKLLKQYGRAGVPAYVIYPAGSSEHPIVLPELLTQQIVMDGLINAAKKQSN
jgi:thiol:disulfide interchange protein DsbD